MMSCSSRSANKKKEAALKKWPSALGGPALLLEQRVAAKAATMKPGNQMCPKDLLQQYLAAYPAFVTQLNAIFPGAMSIGEFLADLTGSLNGLGFEKGNAIPMLSLCRDEITHPFADAVELLWGNSFSLGSIAAMCFAGTTGLAAGMHHAPISDDVERFIFIVAPHIAISDQGVIGKVWRPGVPNISSACGSLVGYLTEMQSGTVNYQIVTTDLEQSMMKGQMSTYVGYGPVPTLQDLTKEAQKLIQSQLQATLATFNLTGDAEYVVVSGVQVHGPAAANFFWPVTYYHVDANGVQTNIGFGSFGQGKNVAIQEVLSPLSF